MIWEASPIVDCTWETGVCSAVRYELLQEFKEDDDECLDMMAMARKDAARDTATRQVLDESAKVCSCQPSCGLVRRQTMQCHAMPSRSMQIACNSA